MPCRNDRTNKINHVLEFSYRYHMFPHLIPGRLGYRLCSRFSELKAHTTRRKCDTTTKIQSNGSFQTSLVFFSCVVDCIRDTTTTYWYSSAVAILFNNHKNIIMSYVIAAISNAGGAPEQAYRKMQSAGACPERPFAGTYACIQHESSILFNFIKGMMS
jgi:hypothetical protein